MFNSITIKYDKQTHTLGNIVECLLFYDSVCLIIDNRTDLPTLWSKIGIEGLERLRDYGLHLFVATNMPGCGGLNGKSEDVYLMSAFSYSMRQRVCDVAVKEFYGVETLDAGQQKIANHYFDIFEEFTIPERVRDAVHDDIYTYYVHKEILQSQLREINSSISMFDPRNKYEFKRLDQGFVFDTNIRTGELEEQAHALGYHDMCFRHASLLNKMTSLYGVMELAAQKDSSLSVTPAESLIISCKQKSIISRYSQETQQIADFEKYEVSEFADIAKVIDDGGKTIDEILELLDSAQEFKKWKSSLPNESDFLLEYRKALQANLPWVQRLSGKIVRFIISSGIGAIPFVGAIAGPIVGGFDAFVVDKWQHGMWKPAQFVNGSLKIFTELKEEA